MRITRTKCLAVLLGLFAALCLVAGAVPQFPQAYNTNLVRLVEMMPHHNVTWTNGRAYFNRQLLAAKLSGTTGGMGLTNLDLFTQRTRYVIDQRYCQKERLQQDYSDPLDLVKYTSYAGTTTLNGRSVQQWSYSQGSFIQIDIFTTNDANHYPVRLFFLQSGSGVLIDYGSFSSGSSSSDFQPPASCSGGNAMEGPAHPLQPIFDFLTADPIAISH
jgi:hypothetical protein